MSNEDDREWQLQQRADERPDDVDDSAADEYRLVMRAVRRADIPPIPANFARHMEQLTRDYEEQAGFESAFMNVLSVVAGAAVLAGAARGLMLSFDELGRLLQDAPWSLLGAATFGVVAVALAERLHARYREQQEDHSA